jgi:hypothetical protein
MSWDWACFILVIYTMSLLFLYYFLMSNTCFIMLINKQYLHCMPWYTGTYGRTMMVLLYRLDPMIIEITWVDNEPLIQWLFYDWRTMFEWGHIYDFASSVGQVRHGRAASIWWYAYNILGIGIVLQVHQDSANSTRKELIS